MIIFSVNVIGPNQKNTRFQKSNNKPIKNPALYISFEKSTVK